MEEIIVKREDIDTYTSIEITDENKLRIQMRIDEAGMHEDFALEEIDDLIEAISIIKDRLERKLSPKNDIVTSTEQKDVNIVSDNEQKLVYSGQIADFPIEVVEKMLERQVEQGNKRDVSVFENKVYASFVQRGFSWDRTQEGDAFWRDIVYNENFSRFFERYPKKQAIHFTPDSDEKENIQYLIDNKIQVKRFDDAILTVKKIEKFRYPILMSNKDRYSFNGFWKNFTNLDGSEFYND